MVKFKYALTLTRTATLVFALTIAPSYSTAALQSRAIEHHIESISKASVVADSYRDMRELFELTEQVMLNKRLLTFISSLAPGELKVTTDDGQTVEEKTLTSTQILYVLNETREFWPSLKEYLAKVNDENAEKPKIKAFRKELAASIKQKVESKHLDEKIAPLNSPAQPLVLQLKGIDSSYDHLSLFVDHPSLSDPRNPNSPLIPPDDLRTVLIDFIDSAQKEIYANFFENNLPEVSDALLRAKKRGVKVLWGMDKNTTALAPENIEFLKKLQDNESETFKAVLIDPVGLNHQKMVVIDPQEDSASLLQSSGNDTQSCIGPEGDQKFSDHRDPRSLPNANHTLIIKGRLPALVGEFQLRKNLIYGLRGSRQFPIDGSYMLPGPVQASSGDSDFVILAYSPNGGMGDVNDSLLVPVIRRTSGSLWTMQFAFSSPDVQEAISKRILASKGTMDFRAIGDTPFAMQDWSGFLALSGMQRSKGKVYSVNKNSPLVKGLGPEALAKLQANIRVNRKMFGEWHVQENGQDVKISVKLHHKVWIFPDNNMAIVGTSFNTSTAAESNQENLALVRNAQVSQRIGGALMWLWSHPDTTSLKAEAERRNSSGQQANDGPASEDETKEVQQENDRGIRAKAMMNIHDAQVH